MLKMLSLTLSPVKKGGFMPKRWEDAKRKRQEVEKLHNENPVPYMDIVRGEPAEYKPTDIANTFDSNSDEKRKNFEAFHSESSFFGGN